MWWKESIIHQKDLKSLNNSYRYSMTKNHLRKIKKLLSQNAREISMIYFPLIIVFIISVLSNDFSFTDKLIELSFIMFAIFIAAITISNKNPYKNKMLEISYIFFLSGLLFLINSQVIKIDKGFKLENIQFAIFLFGGLLFFIKGIYRTFNLMHKIVK
jgi:hypothetical protein